MIQLKTLVEFRDSEAKKLRKVGEVFEVTPERAKVLLEYKKQKIVQYEKTINPPADNPKPKRVRKTKRTD